MIYYKVISNKLEYAFDGKYRKANINSYRYNPGNGVNYKRYKYSYQYIADELFTVCELKHQLGIEDVTEFPFLQKVEVPKNKIHWFFGCRFEDDRTIYYNKAGDAIC